ncbi:hypothetical protein Taro_037985 [Colocasia esculenta]|uniref:Uncharacterized protein n=1 Tax=Colocasia esculenta TaxID=4460 RepID=A0A843WCL2_COLES|nr:hypothetical protein [Colocasia esculenta]
MVFRGGGDQSLPPPVGTDRRGGLGGASGWSEPEAPHLRLHRATGGTPPPVGVQPEVGGMGPPYKRRGGALMPHLHLMHKRGENRGINFFSTPEPQRTWTIAAQVAASCRKPWTHASLKKESARFGSLRKPFKISTT